jgi:NAD(P)-dependent dehydrogenase (short-subunit alcohol dehydrogenase family)
MKADNQMKRIVVLGATSGIGRALVILLREKGYDVIATGRRKALLDSLGGETLELDVTAPDAIQRIAALKADTSFLMLDLANVHPFQTLPEPNRLFR